MQSYRIIVVGTTGSGKTTLAGNIAAILEIPHIESDALHWDEHWQEASKEVLRQRMRDATQSDSWVVDGNYSKVRDIIWPRATHIVWLDYPFLRNFWRLFSRTLRRLVMREELWNGNREHWKMVFFSKDSLFIWFFQTYGKRKAEYPKLISQPEYAHITFIRLRSVRQTNRWLQQLERQPL